MVVEKDQKSVMTTDLGVPPWIGNHHLVRESVVFDR